MTKEARIRHRVLAGSSLGTFLVSYMCVCERERERERERVDSAVLQSQ